MRRVHVEKLTVGRVWLGAEQSHHLRNVLRVEVGAVIEAFESGGGVAAATVVEVNTDRVAVEVSEINTAAAAVELVVAAAVPKGDRADWMVEKLSEIGVAEFVPLACERSVVLPGGKNKVERWERIAVEAAKQSRRAGVMRVGTLISADRVAAEWSPGCLLSTGTGLSGLVRGAPRVTLLVGPEGGWTADELAMFAAAGWVAASLGTTILRVETAAVVAAGIVMCGGWSRPG